MDDFVNMQHRRLLCVIKCSVFEPFPCNTNFETMLIVETGVFKRNRSNLMLPSSTLCGEKALLTEKKTLKCLTSAFLSALAIWKSQP